MTVVLEDNKLKMTKEHEAFLCDADVLKFSNGATYIREDVVLKYMSDYIQRLNHNG